jgi:hypothetical protein
MTKQPRKPVDPLDFLKPHSIDSTEWFDWPAYHEACDKRDKPKLRVIDGGKDGNSQ